MSDLKTGCIALMLLFSAAGCITVGEYNHACFEDGSCVKVEVVTEPDDVALGLMYREDIPEDRGMLFSFPDEGYQNFWMKNMRFPLDIIWINKNNEVVQIEENAMPCDTDACPTYSSKEKAAYVLEVNANYTIEHNITVGSKIRITE